MVSKKLNAIYIVRRAVNSKIGKFTKSDMMELCPMTGKTLVENSLKQLIEGKIIIKHGIGEQHIMSEVTQNRFIQ